MSTTPTPTQPEETTQAKSRPTVSDAQLRHGLAFHLLVSKSEPAPGQSPEEFLKEMRRTWQNKPEVRAEMYLRAKEFLELGEKSGIRVSASLQLIKFIDLINTVPAHPAYDLDAELTS